jgi:hypothetical protein
MECSLGLVSQDFAVPCVRAGRLHEPSHWRKCLADGVALVPGQHKGLWRDWSFVGSVPLGQGLPIWPGSPCQGREVASWVLRTLEW